MFHVTPAENLESILAEGIKPGVDGASYFCETIGDAVVIMGHRFLPRPVMVSAENGMDFERDEDGNPTGRVEQIVDWVVIEVHRDHGFEESFDHNHAFFGGAEAFLTDRLIEPELILGVNELTVENDADTVTGIAVVLGPEIYDGT